MNPTQISEGITKQLEAAWNEANGEKFAEAFTSQTDFVNVRGGLYSAVPKAVIGKEHQAIFDSIYKNSNVKYEISDAVFIDENTILAHIKGTLECPQGPLKGITDAVMTIIVIPENGEWKIRAFQNTIVHK